MSADQQAIAGMLKTCGIPVFISDDGQWPTTDLLSSANPARSSARMLSRRVILLRLRRRGYTLWKIARQAQTSAGYVSAVLGRQVQRQTPLVERIWAEVERALAGEAEP